MVELLVVVALLGLLTLLTLASLRGGRGKASSTSLAEVTTEVLREARQMAMADRIPVAVGFPSSGGTSSVTRSYYLLAGEDKPKIISSRNFDRGLAPAVVFTGTWGTPETAARPLTLGGEPFLVATWSGGTSDALIVFLPSGEARANRPLVDGAYRVLVAEAVELGGTFPHTAQACTSPRTITVTPLGSVAMVRELQPSGVAIQSGTPENLGLGLAPAPSAPGVAPPIITDVSIEPDASGLTLPAGVTAVAREDDFLTFVVRATDSDGGPLFASWSGPGAFSGPDNVRMEWRNSVWEGVWTWKPPVGGTPGVTIYDLECTVRDAEGFSTVTNDAQSPKIQLAREGRVVARDYKGALRYYTPEGAPLAKIEQLDLGPPLQSPSNWMQVDVASGGDYLVASRGGNLYYYNGDGSGERLLFPNATSPSLSRDGTMVAFVQDGDTIVRARLDGTVISSTIPSITSSQPFDSLDLSPDGNQVLFTFYDNAVSDIRVRHLDFRLSPPTESFPLENLGLNRSVADFSPDGSKILIQELDLYLIDNMPATDPPTLAPAGSEALLVTTPPGNFANQRPAWSPDSQSVMYLEVTDHGDPTSISEVRLDGTPVQNHGRNAFDVLNWISD